MITTQESELPAVAEEAVEVAAETVTDGVATPPMSKKAAELDRSLRKKGVMWSNFSRGISPLEYINIVGDVTTFGPQYAQIILRKLVRSEELKIRDIQTALVDELNWKDSTARSHIAIMQSLLVHYGYIKIDGDKWVLVK